MSLDAGFTSLMFFRREENIGYDETPLSKGKEMTPIEFAKATHTPTLEMLKELYDKSLASSKGKDAMTPQETKLAILALEGTIRHQQALIEVLMAEVTKLQTPKQKRFHFFKK